MKKKYYYCVDWKDQEPIFVDREYDILSEPDFSTLIDKIAKDYYKNNDWDYDKSKIFTITLMEGEPVVSKEVFLAFHQFPYEL